MKILLAGTPSFSVPIFEEVIKNFEVVAVVSQPDKPANRGYKLEPTPVKLLAEKYNLKVFQPNKISEIYDELAKLDFDVFLSCAFGQFVPDKVLKLAKKAALNVHGSLLPKYRGAAPIQYSLLNGDKQTGITIIYMVNKMDAGDILFKKAIDIEDTDTSDSLFEKLSILGTENIVSWLKDFEKGNFTAEVQDESQVVLSPKLLKEDALLDPTLTTEEAFNKIRAFSSNPGAYLFVNGKRLKVYYASKKLIKNAPILEFSDGKLYAQDYQFESKKRVKL
ncbi:methionyl-tRNA formyltransferase [Mycoplasmopsis gallinacea]|uniref:Methionyl-tRNA formyltransferase n=1 Tax=Mycoplasmopsis gallinacea TaxID=29556 RepID=A0A6H0V2U0_9BACT|nr:methionyl-tRNA formyltransferase [Mycoplasmopsis gallinacea]QIW62298.1 methionyl-tRNA formyltransferase [Mycoplasmopsis gallinacea]